MFDTACRRLSWLLAFLVSTAAVFTLQWRGGAYSSELGGNDDEAAHFITTLMVRDYLAAGLPERPVQFASAYYEHYPKVAMGHWPPVYYGLSAVWIVLLPAAPHSLLVLQALVTGAWLSLCYAWIRTAAGNFPALVLGAALFASHLVTLLSRQVMSDLLVALLVVAGCLLWAAFMGSGRSLHLAGFGLCATLAALTKGTGFLLYPIPGLNILILRRWDILRRPGFWICHLLMVGAVLPWYLLAPGAMHQAAMPSGPLNTRLDFLLLAEVFRNFVEKLSATTGSLTVALSLVGGLRATRRAFSRSRTVSPELTALVTLVAMSGLYLAVYPARDQRHVLLVQPAILLLGWSGAVWLLERLRPMKVSPRSASILAAVTVAVGFAAEQPRFVPKQEGGFARVVEKVLACSRGPQFPILISSDAAGEGMFISELACREKRPGHRVVRGSKLFFSSTWWGANLRLRASRPDEVERLLEEASIQTVVFDSAPVFKPPHYDLLHQALKQFSGHWQLVEYSPSIRRGKLHPDAIHIYVRTRMPSPPRVQLRQLRSELLRRQGAHQGP